jgi:glyoxylase-like metal-dependent hydrolase (beta-lactamase superfamily II)
MRVCIHRGTKQIGGTCVEIEASGSRIIVDLGLPLDAVEVDPALIPQIPGLREHDPSLLAIVLSHGHRDHWGLIPKVRPDIPIVMGQAAERIMRAAADYQEAIEKAKDHIKTAYRQVCCDLKALQRPVGKPGTLDPLIEKAATDDVVVNVDPNPRLVIVGYDNPQWNDTRWKDQLKKLTDSGCRVISRGDGADVRLDRRRPVP